MGDYDKDGFNEAEECYVLKPADDGVLFILHGGETPRMSPAFKVAGWTGEAPNWIALAGKPLSAEQFNAAVEKDTLLIQILQPVSEDVQVAITKGR